jgi:aryl-alcohol dehydrogenase
LLRWFAQGQLPLDRIIEYYGFSEIDRAFADVASGQAIKVVVTMGR